MGLISKTAQVIIHPSNIVYYENLGYEILKRKASQSYKERKGKEYVYDTNTPITVNVSDLQKGSHAIVTVQCDVCGKIYEMAYKDYLIGFEKHKYVACHDCSHTKNILTVREKYGVDNVFQNEEIKQIIYETNMKKYGFKNPNQSPEIKEKKKDTNMKKYGVPYSFQNFAVIQKREQTMMERYGVTNPSYSPVFIEKIAQTNLRKRGVRSSSQDPEVKKKIHETMYKNGTVPTSYPQRYIHSLIGGELNFPISYYNCDIVFQDLKFVFEYDGGGHRLSVITGDIDEEQFNKMELIRDKIIKNEGYKIIRLISLNDKLPSDEKILEIFEYAKIFFKDNPERTWIHFDIDNSCIYNKYYNESCGGLFFDYGELRYLRDPNKKK